MDNQSPVLIVDAGGTLVTRTRVGLAGRVVQAVRAVGDDRPEREIRTAVLTAAEPDACLRALDLHSPTARAAVLAELTADPGETVVLPGAEELLRTAAELGWRIIVASNAGPGTPPLPAELGHHVGTVVESRGYGLVKEDPRFWVRLLEEEKVDGRLALVVGDDPVADGQAPQAVGVQSRLLRSGGTELTALTAQLRAAGPRPQRASAVVAGQHERWAGRDVIVAPHLADLVTRVTRAKLFFSVGESNGTVVLVRRRTLPPAVVAAGGPLPELAWLYQPPDRRPYQAPAELKELLEREGLSLDGLSPADRRHALSMIREARSSAAVAARVADLLVFLKDREKGGSN